MIELIVFDIDGVITDGSVTIDSDGNEQKQINLKDIDAIFELHRRGYKLAAITGEDTKIVNFFEKRFPWDYFYRGNKKKKETLQRLEQKANICRENICYIGDGKYDIAPLAYAGLGVCPADAIDDVKNVADIILFNMGGRGCIWELISILEKYNDRDILHNYFLGRLEEHICLLKRLSSAPELLDTLTEVGDRIIELFKNKGNLYLCGTDCHMTAVRDITASFFRQLHKNDQEFHIEFLSFYPSVQVNAENNGRTESCFSRQLEVKVHSGDMLISISDSDISENILEAIRYAGDNGIVSVLFIAGNRNEQQARMVDYTVEIPEHFLSGSSEAFFFIARAIAEYVGNKIFGGK